MNDLENLLNNRLLLVTGKGGIGKSFVSTSLAVKAAQSGRRVCIIEANPQDQISPLFGFDPARHQLRQLFPNIDSINLDLHKNFRDFFVKHLGFEQLFDRLLGNAAISSFLKFIPGLLEVTLLGRLYYESQLREQAKPYDLVIFDCFASGHFLNLMTTPEAVFEARIVGPLRKETERVQEFLGEKTTGTLMVTAPEPLIASECIDFCDKLAEKSPARVAGVWINKFPHPVSEVEEAYSPAVKEALDYARAQQDLANTALEIMRNPLSEFGRDHEDFFVGIAPDMGVVSEPITGEFVKRYFAESRVWLPSIAGGER